MSDPVLASYRWSCRRCGRDNVTGFKEMLFASCSSCGADATTKFKEAMERARVAAERLAEPPVRRDFEALVRMFQARGETLREEMQRCHQEILALLAD